MRQQLGLPGLRWVMGTGYVNLWTIMHRAEEALIEIDALAAIISGAVNDRMRVTRSKLNAATQTQLVREIATAVAVLDPSALAYLDTTPVGGTLSPPAASQTHVLQEPSVIVHVPGVPRPDDALGRATLRHVRWAVNNFRDELWDSLVRTRNHLLAALTVTGLFTYLLLLLAIAAQMSGGQAPGKGTPSAYLQDPIVAGAVFYLVGAVVGLFNLVSTTDSASDVDDYGLTMVRLLLTPVISGLAAVIGVFVIAALPATFNGQVISPPMPTPNVAASVSPGPAAVVSPSPVESTGPTSTPIPAPTATPIGGPVASPPAPNGAPPPVPALENVYNLGVNRFGLVIAAAFGLTPSLLVGALKRVPEEYKAALASTQATGRDTT
jgi:hypothetical protein